MEQKEFEEKYKFLTDIFYDVKEGFVSLHKFIQKVHQKDKTIPVKFIKMFYEAQSVNQVLKVSKPQKVFSSIRASFPAQKYQIDIIVYDRYEIHNYKYILCVIDVYSRLAQCQPMTNRKLETIIKAYSNILESIQPPETIQGDNEFNKESFIKFCKETGTTKFLFSDPNETNKNMIVERFNRTITGLIQKVRLGLKRYDWYKYLDDLVENYNNTIHSTTQHTPIEVYTGQYQNEQDYINVQYPYNIGDKVRILQKKKTFEKGDTIKASDKLYIIEGIQRNKYKLFDVDKLYKPYELSRSDYIDTQDYADTYGKQYIQEKQPENTKKVKRLMKREGIDLSNIIEGKRERKPAK